jgi:hypothetical protein
MAMSEAATVAGGEQGIEISEFRHVLASVLATLTVRDRLGCADSIMVLDLALEHLLLLLPTMEPGGQVATELEGVERVIERLKVPVLQYLAAHSRADRGRHFNELMRRVDLHRQLVERIAAVVAGGRDAAAVLVEWESRCARRTLLTVGEEIEARLKKVDIALGIVRTGEETRASAFKEELTHYANTVDETMQEGRNGLDALIQMATHEGEEARQEITRLREEVGGLVGGAVVKGISAGYEAAENRERRSAVRWRVFAVVVASLGAAQLALAWFLSEVSPTLTKVLAHVGVTVACGGIAAYAARQAAQHLREQRALRSDQLRMVASIIWMDRMAPSAREEMQKELAGTFFRATERDKDDLSPETLSLLPIDKIVEIATNVSKPKSTIDDAQSN